MSSPNFVDYVKIYLRSGRGGAGSVHFRREKYIPKGGPDGGNGGRGGHIILRANAQLWTLLPLKYTKHVFAGDGKPGAGNRRTGADGQDKIIDVPVGCMVKNAQTGEILCELSEDGQEVILLKGGRGGMGNDFFKTATLQTPRFAQEGEPGSEGWYIIELKLLADVGLVGFPNAGKSTLLSVVSAAKPEIADYPFTTLQPNLGLVSYKDHYSFVMADIPGIIEGAHQGKGLGLRFLRHIERNSLLLFMIPINSQDILSEYHILLNELKQYNPELLDKDRILAITKTDLVNKGDIRSIEKNIPDDLPHVFISSVAQIGLEELKDLIWKQLTSNPHH
ncbi:MAG: GTPase obg [Bacteroidetes bacterium 38_7]|jgi:GTP-binding protein|nr:MAG: GTPase obg [Bacteroidetes bacterium 38_7]HAL64279.1 GTPase ObgE [Bacteroidales bacterium]